MIRVLKGLGEPPGNVRWLDPATNNTVRLQGLRYHFQYTLSSAQVLNTMEYGNGLREAMLRHNVRVPQRIDGWLVFDEPRAGFDGVLIEAKSGDTQDAYDTVYQLKAYRAALKTKFRKRLLIWGITKNPVPSINIERAAASSPIEPSDHWVFSSADDIARVLRSLGLARSRTNDAVARQISADLSFSQSAL